MIRLIEDNDTLDAIRLMKEYVTINGEFHGFDYNEAVWMRYFLDIVEHQKTNPQQKHQHQQNQKHEELGNQFYPHQ